MRQATAPPATVRTLNEKARPRLMQELLNKLEAALQAQTPSMTAAFAKPATDGQIRRAEESLEVTFPDDLRAFLRCANGQKLKDGIYPTGNFIVPRMHIEGTESEMSAGGHFLGIDGIVEHTGYHRELAEYGDDEERQFIGPVTSHYNHIILTASDDPVALALDLQPGPGGTVGQVVTINDQPDYTACLAPSLTAFLTMLVDGFQQGRFLREQDGTLTEKR